jgi:hypothetical protein
VLAGRAALLPWLPAPEPSIHDEFSYLLAGETFALGRMTNPPHPLWEFFETNHVLQQPTYASKYPPMQGLALAVGIRLGHPWIGVWLTTGILCGVICWMLQGWLPPRMALLGAVVAALRIGISGYWMNSYWGGSMAALGGTLVLGAVARLRREPRGWTWAVFAVGVGILANCRPYEGLALTVISLGVVGWWHRAGLGAVLRSAVVPCLVVGVAVAALTGLYNYRVGGNALLLPYMVYQQQYALASPVPFAAAVPDRVYRHEVIRKVWEWDKGYSERARARPIVSRLPNIYFANDFFLGGFLFLGLLVPLVRVRDKRVKAAVVLLGLFLIAVVVERVVLPHYLAPAAGLIFLLLTVGLVSWWRWNRVGRVVVCLALGWWTVEAVWPAVRPDRGRYGIPRFAAERKGVIRDLMARPGRHLVIVRYRAEHNFHEEWVYNSADLDGARILWARDMGEAANRKLVGYCGDRSVWVLEPDLKPVRLAPYERPIE